MNRLFLIGITQNQAKNIKELTDPIWEYIDGLCFVDHGSTDGTRELLESRKGAGKIIDGTWVNNHDFSLNRALLEGGMKEGDFFVFRDSMERFNPEWVKNIKPFFSNLHNQGVNAIFNFGKIFAAEWTDRLYFQGNPHFGLMGLTQKIIDLKDYYDEDKHEHTWRIRDGEEGGRPLDNKIDHEAKYAWVYGRSNHLLLGMEGRQEEYHGAEGIRNHARWCAKQLGVPMTIDGLKTFISKLKEENPENLVTFINSHRVWKNFYRHHFLKHHINNINLTENDWRLVL